MEGKINSYGSGERVTLTDERLISAANVLNIAFKKSRIQPMEYQDLLIGLESAQKLLDESEHHDEKEKEELTAQILEGVRKINARIS